MPQPNYRKLTPTRRTLLGSSELWLGGDHLLLVVRHWWTEKYQRFRFTDIQSIVVTERPSARTLQQAGLAATLILLVAVVAPPLGAKILWAIPLAPVILVQIVDLAKGSRCRVDMTTAVSSVRLPAITRMRVATRFLGSVLPFVEAAQGQLAPLPPPLPPGVPEATAPAPIERPPELQRSTGRRRAPELILFAAAVCVGGLSLAWLWGAAPAAMASLAGGAALVCIVLGAVVGFGNVAPPLIRWLALGILVLGAVDLVSSMVLFVQAVAAQGGGSLGRIWEYRPDWIRQWGPPLSFLEIGAGLIGAACSLWMRDGTVRVPQPREMPN